MSWFSSTIRIACLIEGLGLSRYMDSVHLFRARDFDEAFQRAIQVGKKHEEEYINGEGARVRWRVAKICTLDLVGQEVTDGLEICSGPVENFNESFDFEHVFSPETSQPTQSL